MRAICYILALICFALAFLGHQIDGHDAVAAGLFLVALAWFIEDCFMPAWTRGRP